MSFFVANWLPTLLGAAVFSGLALAVLAIFSAIATKIEDRIMRGEEQDADITTALAA